MLSHISFLFKVENLRFSSKRIVFCLFFPFSSLDVCKYASRSKTKNSAPNLLVHTVLPIDVTSPLNSNFADITTIKHKTPFAYANGVFRPYINLD